MKLSCEIVRDLLPLYAEELASEDSRAAVEAHLCECAGCRAELKVLKQPVPVPAEEPGMGRLKKEIVRRRWLAVMCGMLAVLLVMSCVGCWLFNPIYLPKTVVESVELSGEWADLGRTTFVRIWASPKEAGYRSISCYGRIWEDGVQYVVFYTTRYRELTQEIPEDEFVSVRPASNTIWLFSEDGVTRLLHGADSGQRHHLGGTEGALHANVGAGEGGVLPGVTRIAQTGGGHVEHNGGGGVAHRLILERLSNWTAMAFLALLVLGLLLRKKRIGRLCLSLSALCYCYLAAQNVVSGELYLSFFWKRELLWAVLIAGCSWGIGMCVCGLRRKR